MDHAKGLIEVALPLDAISKASARGKSIRHLGFRGHRAFATGGLHPPYEKEGNAVNSGQSVASELSLQGDS